MPYLDEEAVITFPEQRKTPIEKFQTFRFPFTSTKSNSYYAPRCTSILLCLTHASDALSEINMIKFNFMI